MDKTVSFFPKWKAMLWLRLGVSKTRRLCPSEAKPARFQASLSSPFGRGTMPAQPSNGFLNTQPEPIHSTNLWMLSKKVVKILSPINYNKSCVSDKRLMV
jgi:hypothetical protein